MQQTLNQYNNRTECEICGRLSATCRTALIALYDYGVRRVRNVNACSICIRLDRRGEL